MKNKLAKREEAGSLIEGDKLKALIKSTENAGTTIMQTSQEFLLVIEDVLIHQFGFSVQDIIKLHNEVRHILEVSHVANGLGLSTAGSAQIIRLLGEIAELKKKQEALKDSGIKTMAPTRSEVITKLLGK